MALKLSIPFPIFAPPLPNPNEPNHRPQTEIRFSRWNNANAEKFNQRQRAQQEIEDDLRRHRRFESARKIANTFDSSSITELPPPDTYKSKGTPSSPSSPSIPGKKSKYSKPPNHPAFRKISRTANPPPPTPLEKKPANVLVGDDGVSFVIDGAPFEFMYSYTETPKVKPLKLREPPYSPFGPTTTPRPWTGRAPLPPSKKKMKEFDSFVLPPPNKKGVKPIQKPGPYLEGTGPRYVQTREEILGEPLTSEEVKNLVDGCLKTKRQLNMGRDGLTHNMLDNIHAHWKRRRVCKIKCKGVCTVDMDNVCEQLEERTGGKVIYRRGGVLYLFRGRNYNYKTRPRFPIMLWKPATPVYPRLIERVPEGLTLEEATEMRKKGRKLIPVCKLAKNGVYSDLVRNVREAFEVCELVRINCEGIKGSDYRRIGAKLKELVPCVLISFENEHILIWRGRSWKSSFQKPAVNNLDVSRSNVDIAGKLQSEELSSLYVETAGKGQQITSSQNISIEDRKSCVDHGMPNAWSCVEHGMPNAAVDANLAAMDAIETTLDETYQADDESETTGNTSTSAVMSGDIKCADSESQIMSNIYSSELILNDSGIANGELVPESIPNQSESSKDSLNRDKLEDAAEASQDVSFPARRSTAPCTERILLLRKQAVEIGSAVVLDDATLDADIIYEKAVAFAKTARPGPVFRRQPHNVAAQKTEKQEPLDLEVKEVAAVPSKRGNENRRPRTLRIRDIDDSDRVAKGSLKVDELAKLLA